jgi:hypothetical protein
MSFKTLLGLNEQHPYSPYCNLKEPLLLSLPPPRRRPRPAASIVLDGASPVVVPVLVLVVVVIVRNPSLSPKLLPKSILAVWARRWCSQVRFNACRRMKVCNGVNASPNYNSGSSDICWDISIHRTGVSIVDVLRSGLQNVIVIVIVFPSSLGIRVCVTIIVQVLDAWA